MGFRKFGKVANVFLVDDEFIVGKAVGQTLLEVPCEVTSFTRARACLEAMQKGSCDLVISDVCMPEMDGLELLKAVKKIKPQLPVLLITGYGEVPLAVEAVKAGAADFLEKPLDEAALLTVVRKVLDENIPANFPGGPDLTNAEKRILKMITDGKSNKEIAFTLGCSTRTVENHRYRLMHKMRIDSTAGLVRMALTLGIVQQ